MNQVGGSAIILGIIYVHRNIFFLKKQKQKRTVKQKTTNLYISMSECTTIEADHYGALEANAAFYHCLVISVKWFISTSVKAHNDRSVCEGLTALTVTQYMAHAVSLTLFELYYLRLWPLCLWNKNAHSWYPCEQDPGQLFLTNTHGWTREATLDTISKFNQSALPGSSCGHESCWCFSSPRHVSGSTPKNRFTRLS